MMTSETDQEAQANDADTIAPLQSDNIEKVKDAKAVSKYRVLFMILCSFRESC